MDDEPPIDPAELANLRFLRRLVTILTATMILGLLVLIVLFVTRFPDRPASELPGAITLPDGAKASAFTQGPDWYAVVTDDDRILIYDLGDNSLRQTIQIRH
ncbi:DUF6476 family protein [Aliiroseovarius sp. PTFE2010]|uniref:DUF6476 family protein n=1 Tax=Aliiroseovarius sp. PTFE2010 TaxID=3417190 RepID=UPI003CF77FD8